MSDAKQGYMKEFDWPRTTGMVFDRKNTWEKLDRFIRRQFSAEEVERWKAENHEEWVKEGSPTGLVFVKMSDIEESLPDASNVVSQCLVAIARGLRGQADSSAHRLLYAAMTICNVIRKEEGYEVWDRLTYYPGGPPYRFEPVPEGFGDPKGVIVYFVQAGDAVKIGKTTCKELPKRMGSLQTGNPHKLELLGAVAGDRERELHDLLKDCKGDCRGEWFPVDATMELIAKLQADGKWATPEYLELFPGPSATIRQWRTTVLV